MSIEIKLMKAPVLTKGGADEQANAMREAILNAPDGNIKGGKISYYVSSLNGDDNNDGLTPETAFKTLDKIQCIVKPQKRVYFERGSVFRLKETFHATPATHYGAYGNGPKPQFLGSQRDYADASIWSVHEDDIWALELDTEEACQMNFNYDTYIGVKKHCYELIQIDGDFYHDTENKKLYLKLSNGNPGEIFDNIEIATVRVIFNFGNANDLKFDNLCVKYPSVHGFGGGNLRDLSVTNCEVSWIGGSYFKNPDHERYGNGLELWFRAVNVTVKNCWFNQIYDAALTFQGSVGHDLTEFREIYFEDNLIEHSSMNFEYWVSHTDLEGNRTRDGIMHDIRFSGNLLRGAGYGWSGVQRPYKGNQAFLLSWARVFEAGVMKSFYITNNTFDCADCSYIYAGLPSEQNGLFAFNNSYYQKKPTDSHQYTQIIRKQNLFANNQEEFESAIKLFDAKPTLVKWLDD